MRVESNPMTLQPSANSQESKIREAAMDFEALLIAQMLHSFRGETDGSGLSGDSDSSSSTTMLEFAEQHLSQVISRQGGLGLHELIVQGLVRKEESAGETQAADSLTVAPPAGQ